MEDFRVHVYARNIHFSQEHADAQHGGEESESNKRWDWEDELWLKNDMNWEEELVKTEVVLRGYKNEELFEVPLLRMRVFNFSNSQGEINQIACSESLYESHELSVANRRLNLILNGMPYANPVPGIYVSSVEFPKELIVGGE